MIDVLVVGLAFGAEFLDAYQAHPLVGRVGVCEANPQRLAEVAERYAIASEDCCEDLTSALAGGRWDAVHLCTPVPTHVELSLQVLDSGRSLAVAVPMATTLADLDRVVEAAQRSSATMMMMETGRFGREYFEACALRDEGALGPLAHVRGSHIQDLHGFPTYWMGFPPLLYATHVVGPLLGIARTQVTSVRALGSGQVSEQFVGDGSQPVWPWMTMLAELDSGISMEASVSFYDVARDFYEGWSVYGSGASLEWHQSEPDRLVRFIAGEPRPGERGRPITREVITPRDRFDLLPESLVPLVEDTSHGGSHAFLAHEFVQSVVAGRPAEIDALVGASICAPGIVGLESARQGGVALPVPRYL